MNKNITILTLALLVSAPTYAGFWNYMPSRPTKDSFSLENGQKWFTRALYAFGAYKMLESGYKVVKGLTKAEQEKKNKARIEEAQDAVIRSGLGSRTDINAIANNMQHIESVVKDTIEKENKLPSWVKLRYHLLGN